MFIYTNVGIAMPLAPPIFLMVGIPPIKMVIKRGAGANMCKWHCYTNISMMLYNTIKCLSQLLNMMLINKILLLINRLSQILPADSPPQRLVNSSACREAGDLLLVDNLAVAHRADDEAAAAAGALRVLHRSTVRGGG